MFMWSLVPLPHISNDSRCSHAVYFICSDSGWYMRFLKPKLVQFSDVFPLKEMWFYGTSIQIDSTNIKFYLNSLTKYKLQD